MTLKEWLIYGAIGLVILAIVGFIYTLIIQKPGGCKEPFELKAPEANFNQLYNLIATTGVSEIGNNLPITGVDNIKFKRNITLTDTFIIKQIVLGSVFKPQTTTTTTTTTPTSTNVSSSASTTGKSTGALIRIAIKNSKTNTIDYVNFSDIIATADVDELNYVEKTSQHINLNANAITINDPVNVYGNDLIGNEIILFCGEETSSDLTYSIYGKLEKEKYTPFLFDKAKELTFSDTDATKDIRIYNDPSILKGSTSTGKNPRVLYSMELSYNSNSVQKDKLDIPAFTNPPRPSYPDVPTRSVTTKYQSTGEKTLSRYVMYGPGIGKDNGPTNDYILLPIYNEDIYTTTDGKQVYFAYRNPIIMVAIKQQAPTGTGYTYKNYYKDSTNGIPRNIDVNNLTISNGYIDISIPDQYMVKETIKRTLSKYVMYGDGIGKEEGNIYIEIPVFIEDIYSLPNNDTAYAVYYNNYMRIAIVNSNGEVTRCYKIEADPSLTLDLQFPYPTYTRLSESAYKIKLSATEQARVTAESQAIESAYNTALTKYNTQKDQIDRDYNALTATQKTAYDAMVIEKQTAIDEKYRKELAIQNQTRLFKILFKNPYTNDTLIYPGPVNGQFMIPASGSIKILFSSTLLATDIAIVSDNTPNFGSIINIRKITGFDAAVDDINRFKLEYAITDIRGSINPDDVCPSIDKFAESQLNSELIIDAMDYQYKINNEKAKIQSNKDNLLNLLEQQNEINRLNQVVSKIKNVQKQRDAQTGIQNALLLQKQMDEYSKLKEIMDSRIALRDKNTVDINVDVNRVKYEEAFINLSPANDMRI